MGKLLHKERVPPSSCKDEVSQLRHNFSTLQNGLHQLRAALCRKMIQSDPVVIRFAAPLVRVFWPIKNDQQDPCVSHPTDQVIYELLRELIDPVQVLHCNNQGPILTLSDEQISESLKDPRLFHSGIELHVLLIINLERQEFLERRKCTFEPLIKLEDLVLQLFLYTRLPISFFNVKVRSQNIEHREVGH